MTTFALVHGAWHDGSCWDLVAPLLERRGHRVVAPDLPVSDLDARVAQLLSGPELIVEDERNGRKRKQNKRALVLALSVVEPQTLRLVTELTLDGSVRPEDILRFLGLDPTEARITREAIEIEPEKSARTASG